MQNILRLLILLTTLLLTGLVEAQNNNHHNNTTILKGVVLDEEGKAIPYARVQIALDKEQRRGRQYTLTDGEGRFRFNHISSEPESRWISIRSLGYHAFEQEIHLRDLSTSGLRIQLQPLEETLSEVVITAISPDVYTRGDTIVFVSDKFATGSEQTLGDVLKELPGMQIDASGQLSFQGCPIHKILINNQYLLTSSTATTLNTFSADFAEHIEVIDDYNDGDIDQDFKSGKQRALNLKTKFPLKVNGWASINGGLKKSYLPAASVISILNKVSLSATAKATNTGELLLSRSEFDSYSTLARSLSAFDQSLPLPQWW